MVFTMRNLHLRQMRPNVNMAAVLKRNQTKIDKCLLWMIVPVAQTLVPGVVEEKGVKESILLETLAMRNMSNSRRSSSYGFTKMRIR